MTARLVRLRAERAARTLVEIQRAIDASVLHTALDAPELEALAGLRDDTVVQLERLLGRMRRHDGLRGAIVAACRSYREWSALDPDSAPAQRLADDLSVRVLELRSALGVIVPRPQQLSRSLIVALA
jgi:hypothetical protein